MTKKWMICALLFITFITTASASTAVIGNVGKVTITPAQGTAYYVINCPVSYSCLFPGDALAAWGANGYTQYNTDPCGLGMQSNGQPDPSRPKYCYQQKTMVSSVPKVALPTTSTTPAMVVNNVPRITMTPTTAVPVKAITFVQHIIVPNTTATPVPIQKVADVKLVSITTTPAVSTTVIPPAAGMQQNPNLNEVPVITPSVEKTMPPAVSATAQSKGIVETITSFLFGWMTPGTQGSMQPHAPIRIISPTTSDTLKWGRPMAVRWDPSFDPNEKMVEITIKPDQSSASGNEIISLAVENNGLCEFTLPNDTIPASGLNQVWVRMDVVGIPETTSWVQVVIVVPLDQKASPQVGYAASSALKSTTEIKVTSPGNGEVIELGKTVQIRWDPSYQNYQHTDADNAITIDLVDADGFQIMRIADNVPNTGTYDWTPSLKNPNYPLNSENDELFKIFAENSGKPCYISLQAGVKSGKSEMFTFGKGGIISVTSPASGEVIYIPDTITLKWTPPPGYDQINVCIYGSGNSLGPCFISPNSGTSTLDKSNNFYQNILEHQLETAYYFGLFTEDRKYIGRSELFSLRNTESVPPLDIEGINYELMDGKDESSYVTNSLKVGYRDCEYCSDWNFKLYRGWIGLSPTYIKTFTGPVKKATLTLHLKSDLFSAGDDTAVNSAPGYSPLSFVWQMDGPWPGFYSKTKTPARDYCYPPKFGGTDSTGKCSYDRQTQIVTIDITDPFNQWITNPSLTNWGLTFLGPDESQSQSNNQYDIGEYDALSIAYIPGPSTPPVQGQWPTPP